MTDEELAPEFETDGRTTRLCVAGCARCGATVFPRQSSCPRCLSPEMRAEVVEGAGELWSWTIQRFPPGPPYAGVLGEGFEPFGVGYVRFGDRVLVEGRLVGDIGSFAIGQVMDVVAEQIPGSTYETFAFAVRN